MLDEIDECSYFIKRTNLENRAPPVSLSKKHESDEIPLFWPAQEKAARDDHVCDMLAIFDFRFSIRGGSIDLVHDFG